MRHDDADEQGAASARCGTMRPASCFVQARCRKRLREEAEAGEHRRNREDDQRRGHDQRRLVAVLRG